MDGYSERGQDESVGKKRLITCEVHPLPRYGMVISVYYYPGTLWLSWISAVVTGP